MHNIANPINVVGLSGLLNVDNDNSRRDILRMEQSILNNAYKRVDEKKEALQYQSEMERLTNEYLGGGGDIRPSSRLSNGSIKSGRSNSSSHTIDQSPFIEQSNDYPAQYISSDPRMVRMTEEERKQVHINKVLNDIEDQELSFDIDREKEEDDKGRMLEQIDALRETLEEDEVNLSGVPRVDHNSSSQDIKNVLRVLTRKNDRSRHCSFIEELILAGAYGLEYCFNGENEWFGRKPDLTGWPETVRTKLVRMRYDTSTFIQDIMQDYQINSGWRILLEILPSMFIYSRSRRLAKNEKKHDRDYKNALSALNEFSNVK